MKKFYWGLIAFWIYSVIVLSVPLLLSVTDENSIGITFLNIALPLGMSLIYIIFAIFFMGLMHRIEDGKKGIFWWAIIFSVYRVITRIYLIPVVGISGLLLDAPDAGKYAPIFLFLLNLVALYQLPIIVLISLVIVFLKKKKYV